MTNIPGLSLNNKFDDIVKINDKEVKANVKKLDKDTTFEQAKKYLEENSDGYDNVGVVVDGERYLVSVIHDNKDSAAFNIKSDCSLIRSTRHIAKVELGNSIADIQFVDDEINSKGELHHNSTVDGLLGMFGGAAIGTFGGPILEATCGFQPATLCFISFVAGAGGLAAGLYFGGKAPDLKEEPTDKLSNWKAFPKAATGSVVIDPGLINKFLFAAPTNNGN